MRSEGEKVGTGSEKRVGDIHHKFPSLTSGPAVEGIAAGDSWYLPCNRMTEDEYRRAVIDNRRRIRNMVRYFAPTMDEEDVIQDVCLTLLRKKQRYMQDHGWFCTRVRFVVLEVRHAHRHYRNKQTCWGKRAVSECSGQLVAATSSTLIDTTQLPPHVVEAVNDLPQDCRQTVAKMLNGDAPLSWAKGKAIRLIRQHLRQRGLLPFAHLFDMAKELGLVLMTSQTDGVISLHCRPLKRRRINTSGVKAKYVGTVTDPTVTEKIQAAAKFFFSPRAVA